VTSSNVPQSGRATLDDLVHQGIPLVGHVVRETLVRVPTHVSREDLTSAGLTALVLAAKAFDPDRGISFVGYASTRIRGAIVDELRSLDWASRSVRRRARQVEQVREQLAGQLGRTATNAEVAGAMGVAVDQIAAHQEDVSRAVVLSLQGFDDTSMDDMLPPDRMTPVDVLEHREKLAYLHDAVAELPERLRAVVEGYFFEERPMAEIADELGVTESRVSQLRAEACVLLKGALNRALEPDQVDKPGRPNGCAARRREAYFAEVASRRTFESRLAPAAHETHTA
jgi:RNA polymerase sigma factor for flagellar operon FliA